MPISPLAKQLARRTGVLFIIFLVAWLVPMFVDFPPRYAHRIDVTLHAIAVVALLLQGITWANAIIGHWTARYINTHVDDRADATTIGAMSVLVKFAVGFVLAIIALDSLGENVTGLIAGLGVGGIAVAFALQNILGDLFGALSIVFDKPFVIGDSIQVDSFSGTVQRIGLKSTRVLSDTGEQIVFGNGDLLKGRIRNFGHMQERRATVVTRVAGSTAHQQLAAIPDMMRGIVEHQEKTRFVRSTMTAIGDTAIEFTTIYYLTDPAYDLYARTQQAVMLEMVTQLVNAGVVLAVQLESAARERIAGRKPGESDAAATAQ